MGLSPSLSHACEPDQVEGAGGGLALGEDRRHNNNPSRGMSSRSPFLLTPSYSHSPLITISHPYTFPSLALLPARSLLAGPAGEGLELVWPQHSRIPHNDNSGPSA